MPLTLIETQLPNGIKIYRNNKAVELITQLVNEYSSISTPQLRHHLTTWHRSPRTAGLQIKQRRFAMGSGDGQVTRPCLAVNWMIQLAMNPRGDLMLHE